MNIELKMISNDVSDKYIVDLIQDTLNRGDNIYMTKVKDRVLIEILPGNRNESIDGSTISVKSTTSGCRHCGTCDCTDGLIYTSNPPKVKCNITNEFHFQEDECVVTDEDYAHYKFTIPYSTYAQRYRVISNSGE